MNLDHDVLDVAFRRARELSGTATVDPQRYLVHACRVQCCWTTPPDFRIATKGQLTTTTPFDAIRILHSMTTSDQDIFFFSRTLQIKTKDYFCGHGRVNKAQVSLNFILVLFFLVLVRQDRSNIQFFPTPNAVTWLAHHSRSRTTGSVRLPGATTNAHKRT